MKVQNVSKVTAAVVCALTFSAAASTKMDEPAFATKMDDTSVTTYIDLISSATKMDETSTKMDETSTKMDGTSTKMDETSTKMDETSTKMDETSTKMDETSTKMDETSTKMDETSTKMDETSTKMDETSTKMDETSTKMDETSTKMDETSTKMDETSTKMDETSTKMDETSTKMDETSTKMDETSTKMDETSTKMDETSTKMDETSTKMDETSTKMDETSTKMDETSTKMDETSTKMDETSTKMDETSTKMDETSTKMDETSTKMDETSTKMDETSTKMDETSTKMDETAQVGKIPAATIVANNSYDMNEMLALPGEQRVVVVKTLDVAETGVTITKFQQQVYGVKVFGATFTARQSATGMFSNVSGNIVSGLEQQQQLRFSSLSAEAALNIALAADEQGLGKSRLHSITSEEYIYPQNGQYVRTHVISYSKDAMKAARVYWVIDANSGAILDHRYVLIQAPATAANDQDLATTVGAQAITETYHQMAVGISAAFSDMTGEAAEYSLHGSNDWMTAESLRDINDPAQDGSSVNAHDSAGEFNQAFYLLADSIGWNTQRAFEIMTLANRVYWSATSTFDEAACGAYQAAGNKGYNQTDVTAAFAAVGINTCNRNADANIK